ncbi:MAG: two-component regulator propeller domain-containing protein [Bacteroidales bacterium]
MKFRLFVFIFLFNTSFAFTIHAQDKSNRFDYRFYSTKQGISNNTITSILQDYKGFIWFGTKQGLDRFDGKSFKIYWNDSEKKSSISNNNINCLFQDSDNTLWIGTRGGGLCRYNRPDDSFTNYFHKSNDNSSISHSEILTIYEDNQKNLWIGTNGGGLNLFNKKTGKFIRYNTSSDAQNSVPQKILSINSADDGNLLLGTWDFGLVLFDTVKKTYTRIARTNNDTLINDKVWKIKKDRTGNFFLGLFEGGIQYFDYKNKQIVSLKSKNNTISESSRVYSFCDIGNNEMLIGTASGNYLASISYSNNIPYFTKPLERLDNNFSTSILKDKSGNIWSTNYGSSLVQLVPINSKFIEQKINTFGTEDNEILSFTENEEKHILIGTSIGIFIFDKGNQSLKRLESLTDNDLLKLRTYNMKYNNGTLWSARSFDIARFNVETQKNEKYFSIPSKISPTDRNAFKDMLFKNNTAWFASENGLYEMDLVTKKFKIIIGPTETSNGFNIYVITSISFYKDGDLLIGTVGGGLITYNPQTGKKTIYQHNNEDNKSISSNFIHQILVAKTGKIWISTIDGLEEFKKEKGSFVHYNAKMGFYTNLMNSIAEDKNGNLWIAGETTISKFNPESGRVWNFNFDTQIVQSLFHSNSAFCAGDGYLFFGRANSFIYFNPDSMKENTIKPDILFSDFKINYQTVVVGKDSPLKINIEDTKEIILKHNQSSFSFAFTVLNFNYPEKNQYAYKLENFDKDWIVAGNIGAANYTNIPHGDYVFRVRASNEDGVWNNNGISVKITVLPAFYETWLFRILSILTIVMAAVFWYKNRIRSIKTEKLKLEKMVAERTMQLTESNTVLEEQKEEIEQQKEELIANQEELSRHKNQLEITVSERTKDLEKALVKAKEADALKSSFLSNMSHEIRTPLNAIVGFSGLLTFDDLSSENRNKYSQIIQSNADALLVLIDDILDFSKIEAGQIDIKRSTSDLNEVFKEIFDSFSLQKIRKGVEFRLNIPFFDNQYTITTDLYRLKQIFNNLISNAIKFTMKGYIEIGALQPENDFFTLYVKDTGIGIAPENKNAIFERFRKVEEKSEKLYRGTGLGLSITKKLVELLGGQIWIDSTLGSGSTFFFTLPMSESTLTNAEKEAGVRKNTRDLKSKKILIVEDIEVNFIYLHDILEPFHPYIIWAKNGKQAVEMAFNNPDVNLIMMDIKLPIMDGSEAMKEIRKFNKEVPIISQTAYALKDQVIGFKQDGFTDHLSKPIKREDLMKIIDLYLSE